MENRKTDVSAEAATNFMNGVITKANSMVQQIDTQTNILIGVNTAIFAFAVARFNIDQPIKPAFVILGVFTALAAIVGLFSLHPPRFMRKKQQNNSLLLPSHIGRMENAQLYSDQIKEVVQDLDKVLEQYSVELYNMSRFFYLPKRQLYRISRNLLLIGIVLSLIVSLFRL